MLDAGEMGRSKDLGDFDKGQIVIARRLGQSISETARLGGAPGQQWRVPTDSGPRRDKSQTGDMVLGAQGSSMREGNEGYPVWTEPTEGRLWHKSQTILMVVMGECVTIHSAPHPAAHGAA